MTRWLHFCNQDHFGIVLCNFTLHFEVDDATVAFFNQDNCGIVLCNLITLHFEGGDAKVALFNQYEFGTGLCNAIVEADNLWEFNDDGGLAVFQSSKRRRSTKCDAVEVPPKHEGHPAFTSIRDLVSWPDVISARLIGNPGQQSDIQRLCQARLARLFQIGRLSLASAFRPFWI